MARDIYHQLYFHIVWATCGRKPVLDDSAERHRMTEAVRATAQRFGGHVLACYTMPDHVHLLVTLAPVDLAQFVGRVKGGSMYTFNLARHADARLRWQDGYGIVSLRLSDAEDVATYINNQEIIHAERRAVENLESTESIG